MPVRYLDSVICPLLFGLGPFLLLGLLTAYIPRFSAWVVTWPGALITAGGCLVIIARGYWLLGDDPGPNAAEEARWARRLPSFIVPLLVCTHTRHAEMPDSLYRPYLALDIDALEAGELDLPDRLFKHSGWRFTTVLSVDPREWLFPDVKGLRGKLDALLLEEGLGKPKGKVWLVTMPRLLGASVKAPLSLWFVYGTQGDLEVVILERHWTMGNT
ncbi:uncharacterized protein MKK02DRAFT_45668 [Dioszegia hungarica]|uniref:Uncharacterized protein n=1 Tax=Dioszegia hungarica TaxID=4972 RepID=A0AA38LX40_9TREE|nr:uncharacterized protein MKK02DRAFT_45668 [Dioszegia hungarica]KAI9636961.1 hypothetical protein MKK02DRAFT_45668 [Dioszegia hungarica]